VDPLRLLPGQPQGMDRLDGTSRRSAGSRTRDSPWPSRPPGRPPLAGRSSLADRADDAGPRGSPDDTNSTHGCPTQRGPSSAGPRTLAGPSREPPLAVSASKLAFRTLFLRIRLAIVSSPITWSRRAETSNPDRLPMLPAPFMAEDSHSTPKEPHSRRFPRTLGYTVSKRTTHLLRKSTGPPGPCYVFRWRGPKCPRI